ncbi:MAG: O-antigen ligase family protein [Candidatus Aminicenantes bacterium]
MIKFTPADHDWSKPRLEKKSQKAIGFLGTPKDKVCSKIIEYGILGILVFSPLPAASVYEWSLLVIEIAVFIMLGAYVLMKHKPIIPQGEESAIEPIKYLFGGFFLYLIFQMIPLPVFLVKVISPGTYHFRKQFSLGIQDEKFMSLSMSPFHTFQEGMELFAYVVLGFLIIKTITKKIQIKRIFYVLLAMGFFEALYGLFELYRDNPRILFYKKEINLHAVTGTFVNQNHFTGYMEMIIPLAIGLIIAGMDLIFRKRVRLREKITLLGEKGFLLNLVLLAFVILMTVGLILSRSRSAVFSLIVMFLVFFYLSVFYFRGEAVSRAGLRKFIHIIFVFIIIFAVYAGIDATLERFSKESLTGGQRPQYWAHTWEMAQDYPVFGTGLGTFAHVYPAYETIGLYGFLWHAHNDYLEYFAELGIIGLVLLLGGILTLVILSFSQWRKERDPWIKGLSMGCFVALAVIAVHSFTDFNLHIPANMVLFTVIVAVVWVLNRK